MVKKVVFALVATALASIVLPVPGGPKSKTPRQGWTNPTNNSGSSNGSSTASFNKRLASTLPAMSYQYTLGERYII